MFCTDYESINPIPEGSIFMTKSPPPLKDCHIGGSDSNKWFCRGHAHLDPWQYPLEPYVTPKQPKGFSCGEVEGYYSGIHKFTLISTCAKTIFYAFWILVP